MRGLSGDQFLLSVRYFGKARIITHVSLCNYICRMKCSLGFNGFNGLYRREALIYNGNGEVKSYPVFYPFE